jgi:hypothetical protein
MMMIDSKNTRQMVLAVLFWGALWGIAEATVGYLAHLVLILPGIAGFIMFPMGFYFMTRAYKNSGKPGVLLATAGVAASIKLVDLFLPGLTPIHTINPAVCILMEAVAVIVVFKAMDLQPVQFRFREVVIASFGWRLGFLFYSAMLFVLSLSAEFVEMSLGHILRFVLLGSVINAVVIAAYLKAGKTYHWETGRSFKVRPVMAMAVLTAAILAELLLAAV